MMDTPICDFVKGYAQSDALRLHMPGHKGESQIGPEAFDITEIDGADSLYEADGVIRRSEAHASDLFGCETCYSTEGSSQCIRAMLYLAMLHAGTNGSRITIAAGRNAHKTFLSAAALLGFQVQWICPSSPDSSYLSCPLDASVIETALKGMEEKPAAVYLTSPDYLGNRVALQEIAEVCHRYGVLLLVDNAHGAYLRFLEPSCHPMDLGADMCCDSAHKTLPVLTGGAYLHVSDAIAAMGNWQIKNALALFGSTSPSYLILQSLDAANRYLADGYPEKLASFLIRMNELRESLGKHGYLLVGDEPLKLTVSTKPYGYQGSEFAKRLLEQGIVCEFSDPDFVVLMMTPEVGTSGLERFEEAMLSIPRRPKVLEKPPVFSVPEQVMSIREAMFAVGEMIPVSESVGRVLAAASVGCPPAVPIVVCGERIDEAAVRCFDYYGIKTCVVTAEKQS